MADNRDDLIEATLRGRMSPAEAEAEADRLGLGPLCFEPPVTDWDPMRVTYWTPVMVAAWIVWRKPEMVREGWSAFVRQRWIWRSWKWRSFADDKTYDGHVLERPEPPSLSTLLYLEAYRHSVEGEPPTKHPHVLQARDQILDALRAGRLHATGVSLAVGGPRREIPAFEWVDLIFDLDADDDRFAHRRGLEHHGYVHVLIRRDQVTRLWKPALPMTPSELPLVVRPDGAGYMTVFHALLWIATAGATEQFMPDNCDHWRRAFEALLPELASGHIPLTGERRGERELVPPYVVASCRFTPLFGDTSDELLHGNDLYLRSYLYVDDEHWRGGFDDALVAGAQERWTRLMVPREAVAAQWPFVLGIPHRTGAQGRPTPMHLVEREFERRAELGELEPSLAAQARVLVVWLSKAHPSAPRLTNKTIENRLRERYRSAHPPK